jgi:hypothetical protein
MSGRERVRTTKGIGKMKVFRIKLWVFGERNYPEALITLPKHIVGDLNELVTRAQALTRGVSIDSVVHTLWRFGAQRLDQTLHRHVPVRVPEIPHASPSSGVVRFGRVSPCMSLQKM